jgi:hypothetical protein
MRCVIKTAIAAFPLPDGINGPQMQRPEQSRVACSTYTLARQMA